MGLRLSHLTSAAMYGHARGTSGRFYVAPTALRAFIGRFPGPASARPASRPMPIPTQATIERAYSAQGLYRPLSWACIGPAGKPADADSDPGYDRARLQRA
jgi:hypothetical protein